ncbi:MAG: DNA cytosine methyltransferase [Pseudomonadota bacterium]|nr:DNA cytosine methyltransferase [Pseudomonadota bacterium]
MKNKKVSYPIVDLFAGPGGLGEGFSALDCKEFSTFHSIVSIEHDEFAHKTLLLRHFFRSFGQRKAPREYYEYISGEISKIVLIEKYPEQWKKAEASALRISLGLRNHDFVKQIIDRRGCGKNLGLLGGSLYVFIR